MIGAAFGSVAGWLNAFIPDGFAVNTHYPVAIVMIGFTTMNLLSRRVDKSLFKFLVETFAMWALYSVFWAVTHGEATENLIVWVAIWSSVAGLAGWWMMREANGDEDGERPLQSYEDQSHDVPRLNDGSDVDQTRDVRRMNAVVGLLHLRQFHQISPRHA